MAEILRHKQVFYLRSSEAHFAEARAATVFPTKTLETAIVILFLFKSNFFFKDCTEKIS